MFRNRTEAGKKLSEVLLKYKGTSSCVVGLPRGGISIAYEVATNLNLPLDCVVVRKIGAPENPEFAVGAIAPGDIIMLDERIIDSDGIEKDALEKIIDMEKEEMRKRQVVFKCGQRVDLKSKETIILVDDGIATGYTAKVAIKFIKENYSPQRIVFATPVGSVAIIEDIAKEVDEVNCLQIKNNLAAIGSWYEEFGQVSNEDVLIFLKNYQQPE